MRSSSNRFNALVATALAALMLQLPGTTAGQEPATAPSAAAPSTPAGDGETLKVVIAEVRGLVRVRATPNDPWQKAAVGMTFGPGAEFQTGPKSACVCTIEDNQTIVLDRLGVVSVAEAVRRSGTVKTDLLMKYGRTEYEIEAAGAKHDATIRSPSSTLAVRGTRVNLYDQPPFTPSAESYTGRAVYQYAKRQTALGGPGRGARVRSDQRTAAESALGETVVDPAFPAARTASENVAIAAEVSRGGLVQFDPRAGINVVRNSPPASDEQLLASLPGRLNFVLRWTGNADLNLVVVSTAEVENAAGEITNVAQELVFPGFGLDRSPAGGRTAFDHRGGPGGGQEVVFYGNVFEPNQYTAQAFHVAGEPTDFTLNAFLDGQPLLYTGLQFDEQGNVVREPLTLPNGTVVQIPVLVEEEVVAGRLEPRDDPATPELIENVRQGTVDLTARRRPEASGRQINSRAAAAAAERPARTTRAARGVDALDKQRRAELKRQAGQERRHARQLAAAERQAAKASALAARRPAGKVR